MKHILVFVLMFFTVSLYSQRIEDQFTKQNWTEFHILTEDCVKMNETMIDDKLSKYSVIILDEAHERSLNSDILLALVKNILENRNLKLVIMSATLDINKFSTYLNSKNIIYVKGRSFPIEIYNVIEEQKNYIVDFFLI